MFEEIKKNFFVFSQNLPGSNVFLITADSNVLIDSGTQANSNELSEALNELGLKQEDVSRIFFSHGHSNHFSGAKVFNQAELRMTEHDALFVNQKNFAFTRADFYKTSFFPKINDFLQGGQEIDLGSAVLKVISTPGHTRGSVCFFEPKKKILFSGDLFFNSHAGRHDYPSGNKKELIASLRMVSETEFDVLCPGHGVVLRADARIQRRNLLEILQVLY